MAGTAAVEAWHANKSFMRTFVADRIYLFLAGWFVLNLVQIAFTELTSDEGYYWFYSTNLQLGYYDHPPMVALLIRAGSALLPGTVGVRIFNLACITGALYCFLSLLPRRDAASNRTFILLLSAPLLNYLSFIVFPDGPLLFFSMLFLVSYRRFLFRADTGTSLLMGLSMALMIYSKYHGLLIIFFVILSHPGLLRSKRFWLACFISILLFLPHIAWQYQNGFPTFRYHLSGRTGGFTLNYLPQFISQQMLAISPALVIVPFFSRAKDVFERSLLFIITGTFLFFLVSSFTTFVHFHWTSIALFPMLYFAVLFYNDEKRKRFFRLLVLPFFVILFVARLFLLINFSLKNVNEDYYHGRGQWAQEINTLAAGRPVFFPNNLREASLYTFYSRATGVALYDRPEKKSQYELWNYEDSLQGKEVLMVAKWPYPGTTERVTEMGQRIYFAGLQKFNSFYKGISIDASLSGRLPALLTAHLAITNNRKENISFDRNNGMPVTLVYNILKDKEIVRSGVLRTMAGEESILPGKALNLQVDLNPGALRKGSYSIYFGFRYAFLPDSYNSAPVILNIE